METTEGETIYYHYDGCGNTVAKQEVSGTTYYRYNTENLMTRIDFAAGGNSYYQYDADSKRVSQRTADGYRKFVYQGPDMLKLQLERDESEETVAHYTMGAGLEAMRRETSSFYHYNHLGTALALTAADEAVSDTYRHDAWGVLLASTGSTVNPHTYVGRERYYRMPDAAMYHLGFRDYAQGVGRFAAADAIRGVDSMYCYAGNAAGLFTDPLGLQPGPGRPEWGEGGPPPSWWARFNVLKSRLSDLYDYWKNPSTPTSRQWAEEYRRVARKLALMMADQYSRMGWDLAEKALRRYLFGGGSGPMQIEWSTLLHLGSVHLAISSISSRFRSDARGTDCCRPARLGPHGRSIKAMDYLAGNPLSGSAWSTALTLGDFYLDATAWTRGERGNCPAGQQLWYIGFSVRDEYDYGSGSDQSKWFWIPAAGGSIVLDEWFYVLEQLGGATPFQMHVDHTETKCYPCQ